LKPNRPCSCSRQDHGHSIPYAVGAHCSWQWQCWNRRRCGVGISISWKRNRGTRSLGFHRQGKSSMRTEGPRCREALDVARSDTLLGRRTQLRRNSTTRENRFAIPIPVPSVHVENSRSREHRLIGTKPWMLLKRTRSINRFLAPSERSKRFKSLTLLANCRGHANGYAPVTEHNFSNDYRQ